MKIRSENFKDRKKRQWVTIFSRVFANLKRSKKKKGGGRQKLEENVLFKRSMFCGGGGVWCVCFGFIYHQQEIKNIDMQIKYFGQEKNNLMAL